MNRRIFHREYCCYGSLTCVNPCANNERQGAYNWTLFCPKRRAHGPPHRRNVRLSAGALPSVRPRPHRTSMIMIPFRATRLAVFSIAASLVALPALPTPPRRRRRSGSVTDTYHGITVPDPYRWMEDMKSAEWQTWLKAQAVHTDEVLARIPGRDAMRKRLAELADAGEIMGNVAQAGGRLFYVKIEPGRSNRRLFMREGTTGPEQLCSTPTSCRPRTAITTSISTRRRRTANGLPSAFRPEVPRRACCASTTPRRSASCPTRSTVRVSIGDRLAADNRSFFYNRLPAPGPDRKSEKYNKSAVYLHALGRDPARDPAVIGWGVNLVRSFAVPDLPYALPPKGRGGPWPWCCTANAREVSVYVTPLIEAKGPATPWRRLIGRDDMVSRVALAGDAVFALSQMDASRGKLARYDLSHPGAAAAVVMPQSRAVLRGVYAAKDAGVRARPRRRDQPRISRAARRRSGHRIGAAVRGHRREHDMSTARDGLMLRLKAGPGRR